MGKRGGAIAAVAGIGQLPTGNYPDRSALEATAKVAQIPMAVKDRWNA